MLGRRTSGRRIDTAIDFFIGGASSSPAYWHALVRHSPGPSKRRARLGAASAGAFVASLVALGPAPAHGQAGPPAPHEETAFDFMNLLSDHGLHDIRDERWNAYGQLTYISSGKLGFHSPYQNWGGSKNSLLPDAEWSFTGSFTVFLGVRLWRGAEAYLVPEVIAERPLSQLRGLGGAIQNFELQKTGSETPQLYRSRTYLRQTIDLGGERETLDSNPMQLGSVVDRRRVVITAGNFSVLDVFDKNSVTGDPRQTFLNMAFMTFASWDFPADARGYSWGATAELFWDDWALRIGRMAPPLRPNQLEIDFRIWKFYGDEVELEHDHTLLGRPGAVRLVGYRNRVDTGGFGDAITAFQSDPARFNAANCAPPRRLDASPSFGISDYGSTNATAPDLCWVRRPNIKGGVGLDVEQYVDENVGVFFKGMYSDGRTEVDAFNSADRSLALGALAKGTRWHRPFDVTGLGFGMSWISHSHAQYLAMGGVDGFVGDGRLRWAGEGVVDAFYSVNFLKALWLTADYQFLWNPGFNADRGPVNIIGGRVHAEF